MPKKGFIGGKGEGEGGGGRGEVINSMQSITCD